jgi:FAD dependent oxidoreductase TIGR03364
MVPAVRLGDTASTPCDLVVVGAGIVGLAHALEAAARGLSVVVVERDDRAVGASVRNFGHGCVTAQEGRALDCARRARTTWARLAKAAGFWLSEAGTVVVARAEDELAVLAQLAERRHGDVRMLTRSDVLEAVAVGEDDVVGGAHLAADIRVDPRTTVRAIAAWLATQPGVELRFGQNVVAVEPGAVRTSEAVIHARDAVTCTGHDVDRLFPDVARQAGVQRCALHMLAVAPPGGRRLDPAVLTGSSMLRYPAFAGCPAIADVRARLGVESPALLDAGVNLMFTQRPNGDVLIGDTHAYARTHEPFRDEVLDELLLREASRLLGVQRLVVRERWTGEYAAGTADFLVESPAEHTHIVSVTTGIGMTTAFGLAQDVVNAL